MSMTIQQLRDELNELIERGEAETEIKFSYNYGDYWRTTVAEDIRNVSEVRVKHSDYHSMDKVLSDSDDERDEPQEEGRKIYILE